MAHKYMNETLNKKMNAICVRACMYGQDMHVTILIILFCFDLIRLQVDNKEYQQRISFD